MRKTVITIRKRFLYPEKVYLKGKISPVQVNVWLEKLTQNNKTFHSRKIYQLSILKSRDVTLPTKVHLVKAMVFPVVMYGCESWSVKKAECQRIYVLNCGVGEDS